MNYLANPIRKTLCLVALCLSVQTQANPYQLFLVRHAEKAASTATDPELSECGKQQAQALATLLGQLQIPKIFHTAYQRTTQTAQALLQPGRSLQTYDPASLDNLSKTLKQAQQSALIVGHSNTTPQLAALLSEQAVPPMSDQQYGLVYQLTFQHQQLVSMNLLQLPQPENCHKK